MKRGVFFLAIALALSPTVFAPTIPNTITSVVEDSVVGEPIAGATITTTSGGKTATTVDSGQYMIVDLLAGTHTVQASVEHEVDSGTSPLDDTGISLPAFDDVNSDGNVNAIDVQLVINAALGIGFKDAVIDGDPAAQVTVVSDTSDKVFAHGAKPTTPVVRVTRAPPSDNSSIDDPPTTTDNLQCEVTTPSVVDGNPIAYYVYSWSSGAQRINHGPAVDLTDTLDAEETMKNQTWTCTVTCYIGSDRSEDASDSTEIVNSPPEEPGIAFPRARDENTPLVCRIKDDEPSRDDDDDKVRYIFEWWVRREGEQEFGYHENHFPDPTGLYTQIHPSDTRNDDTWKCTVTPYDDDDLGTPAYSNECTITSQTPSSISLNIEPETVTLGEPVIVWGEIYPIPEGGAVVSFESKRPPRPDDPDYPYPERNPDFPEAITISGDEYSREFLPNRATDGERDWRFWASWPGDEVYMRAETIEPAHLTVNKAQPTLTLELSAAAITADTDTERINELTATATLMAPIPVHLRDLLAGRTIKLFWRVPDGYTAAEGEALQATTVVKTTPAGAEVGVATFDLLNSGIDFSKAGTWRFRANFDEDFDFKRATSAGYDDDDAVRLIVKDGAGYAIIVLGRTDDAEGHPEHAKTADHVYRVLHDRGFAHEDICYLREVLDGEESPTYVQVDDTATQDNVQDAIEQWALDRMRGTPAPLYVIFLNHGSKEMFHVYSTLDDDDYITPTGLDGYFDTLQTRLEAVGGEAAEEDIVFIYGACHAGSFIPAVSGEHRVIITSCGADELSHRGVIDPVDGIREGEAFVTELFRNAGTGKTLKDSFELAKEGIAEYVAPRSNSGNADRPQQPLLDDPSDRADQLVLGFGSNAGRSVGWLWAAPAVIDADEPLVDLEARADRDYLTEDYDAWVEVKTPDYLGSTAVDPSNSDSQKVVELPRIFGTLDVSDPSRSTFKWTVSALTENEEEVDFSIPGTYKVFYYVMDPGTDPGTQETSSYLLTTVYRALQGNEAPYPVALVYPEDNALVGRTPVFVWEETTDPDGDAFTYRLEVSEDIGFPEEATIVKEGIPGTSEVLSEADGIEDLHTYYWRVVPVDEYGATPEPDSNDVRVFRTEFDNTGTEGTIGGFVTDKHTGSPIRAAPITVTPGQRSTASYSDGWYEIPSLSPGSYTVKVSADGYRSQTRGSVEVEGSRLTPVDFELLPKGPVCTAIPDVSFEEDSTDTSIDLDDYVSDADNTDDQLIWISSGATNVTVSDLTTHIVTLGAAANWYGEETITFTCTNPEGFSDSTQVAVTVNSVNDAPVCVAIPDVSFEEDGTDTSIDLDDYVSDADKTDAELRWTYPGERNVTVSIDSTHAVTLGAAADWYGEETITFTCTDPEGLSDSTQVEVTVVSVNDPPWIDPIIQDLTVGQDGLTYSLTQHEHDVEDSGVGLTWDVNTILFSATIDQIEDELTLIPVNGIGGSDSVELVLHDSDGATASQWVTVTALLDADHDGMPDAWEEAHGLDPTLDDSGGDPDEDGLTNIKEWEEGTDPQKEDTDGDGYTDKEEVDHGGDPTDETETPDPWLVAVTIEPEDPEVWTGTALIFGVTGEMRGGFVADLSTATVKWEHLSGVGAIDPDTGMFESDAAGDAEISVAVELDGVTQGDTLLFVVQGRAIVTVNSETIDDDETVSVAVTLASGAVDVAEVEFTLVIDSQEVEIIGIVAGEQADAAGKTVKVTQVDADQYDVSVGENSSVLADGEIVVITLRAAETGEDGLCSVLELQELACYDTAEEAITSVGGPGHCCLGAPVVAGDIDRNAMVNAVDVQLVISAALGLYTPWDCDIDGNGFVNSIDVQLAINEALGVDP